MTHTQITSTTAATEMMNKKRNRSNMITHPGCGYECKTCKTRFDTYQALGGHQGIHKRVRINDACALNLDTVGAKNLGLHRCKTCMKEFTSGQALGGHMRRHRVEKDLVLMEKESVLWRKQAVDNVESDLVLSLAVVEVQVERVKEVEDEAESELVLAAKEWGLSV